MKQNRLNYTAILDSFIMEQQNKQRKQFSRINNEEFSDEVNTMTGRRRGKIILNFFRRIQVDFESRTRKNDEPRLLHPAIASRRTCNQQALLQLLTFRNREISRALTKIVTWSSPPLARERASYRNLCPSLIPLENRPFSRTASCQMDRDST